MSGDWVRPGARVRILRGHHPGKVCEVVEVTPRNVALRGVRRVGRRELFRLPLDWVLKNCERVG